MKSHYSSSRIPAEGGALLRHREDGILLARIHQLRSSSPKNIPEEDRPLVGIPMVETISRRGGWPLQSVDGRLIEAILVAGGSPVPFPCRPLTASENAFTALWQQVQHFDALVLPDGPFDHDPRWEDQIQHSQAAIHQLRWDDWWFLHTTALATLVCLPVLGIGLGCEYYNVALGGTLYRELPRRSRGRTKHRCRGKVTAERFVSNSIRITQPGIFAECADGAGEVVGACMHQGGIHMLAPDLKCTGVAHDNLVEVIERLDGVYGIGVQFHLEISQEWFARQLFQRLVEEGRRYATRDRVSLHAMRKEIGAYLYGAQTFPRLVLSPSPEADPIPEKQVLFPDTSPLPVEAVIEA